MAWPTTLRGIHWALVLTDAVMIGLAVTVAQAVRFGEPSPELAGLGTGYWFVSLVLVAAWLVALALAGAYRTSVLGHGPQEFRAVLRAGIGVFVALALTSYALQLLLARGYVVVAFPLGLLLICLGRLFWRRHIVRMRRRGAMQRRVLAVGGRVHLHELLTAIQREPSVGYVVEGVCCNDQSGPVCGVEVVGREEDAAALAERDGYELVAWAGSQRGPAALRTLAWDLEPARIGLLVMSDLTEVSLSRIVPQPVSGVPVLHVEAVRFSGARLVVKTAFDYALAVLLLVLSLPVQLLVAAAIAVGDRGPVFYRQTRVGIHGRPFRILKFRTMIPGADGQQPEAAEADQRGAGPLFKVRDDPRITPIGAVLRRFSLDELPQLVNVLRGDMSLVGPRPPLPSEVAAYGPELARRRIVVRPGMTGLWQVSGRSDLTWAESTRLDLYYVDNWSVTGDLVILAQTGAAVLRGRGAY